MSKEIITRIKQKHDTEAMWKASSFIPLNGEIVVYDADDSYDYPRIKIGDGVKTVNELPFSKSEQLQADWNQNDETKADYVKNRTHYVDTELKVLVPSTTQNYIEGEHVKEDEPVFLDISSGDKIIVNVDGTTYTLEAWSVNNGIVGIGDSRLDVSGVISDLNIHPDEVPFFILHYVGDDGVWNYFTVYDIAYSDDFGWQHTIEIAKVVGEDVKQLDEKFIPDTIARKADLPSVSTPDWSVNSESDPAYIKNRTHWVEASYETIISPTTETTVFIETGRLLSNTCLVLLDGVEYVCPVFHNVNACICIGDSRLIVEEDMSNPVDVPFGIETGWDMPFGSFEETATAWIYYPDSEIHTIEVKELSSDSIYHTLDESYIPDSIARKNIVDNLETKLTALSKYQGNTYYGVCETSGDDGNKVIIFENNIYPILKLGDVLLVKFTNTNTTRTASLSSGGNTYVNLSINHRTYYIRYKNIVVGIDNNENLLPLAGHKDTIIKYVCTEPGFATNIGYLSFIGWNELPEEPNLDDAVLITVDDIDTICGGAIKYAEDVMF